MKVKNYLLVGALLSFTTSFIFESYFHSFLGVLYLEFYAICVFLSILVYFILLPFRAVIKIWREFRCQY